MARTIQSLLLPGPAGQLEALLEEPEGMPPREAALVCHPHPLYGGTMRNKVVHRLARALRRNGAVVLRFNFRGVGWSQGEHAGGIGETQDARSALEYLLARYPQLPFSLAGFSFGARVILRLGCALDGAARLIAAGFPTRYGPIEGLERCKVLKVFVQSTGDQYGPKPELEALFARLSEPKRLVWVEATDHFFHEGLDRLEGAVFALGPAR